MLEYFGAIEADFQREYQINLCTIELSWRRFITLFSHLSGDSLFFTILRNRKNKQVEVIEDFDSIIRDMQMNVGKKR